MNRLHRFYSQAGQDEWVYSLVDGKGFYIDVGAYDGQESSNTAFLEYMASWDGICIEPNPDAFALLVKNRECLCINKVVTDYTGICSFGTDRIGGPNQIPCDTLNNILASVDCPPLIDYLSLDIEGHELTVLQAFDFDYWQVKLITVEHNLYLDGPAKKDALFELLTTNGFTRVFEDVKCLDPYPLYFNQPFEDWYQKI